MTRATITAVALMLVASPLAAQAPAAPARPAPLFEADWATATGSSDRALRDLGKPLPFDQCEGQIAGVGGDILHVVPAAGLGFPAKMANVLRVKRNSIDSWAFCRIGASGRTLIPHWPQLAVGHAFYWRVYLRYDIPNSEGNVPLSPLSHHPIQMPHAEGSFEPVNLFSNADGTMDWEGYTLPASNAFPWDKAVLGKFVGGERYGATLPKFTVLRFEWMARRDTDRGFSFAFRITDATAEASGGAGKLLWSEDGKGASRGTVMNERGDGQETLRSHDGRYAADLDVFQSLSIGENGGWHSYRQDVFFYFGGLKLCADTWCGAY